LNIFPIYPLATQGYYVRQYAPEILATQQRYHSFMNFYGMVDSRHGDRSSLSWQTYAAQRTYFDLLGVDLLIDHEQGELSALVEHNEIHGLKHVESADLTQRKLRVYRSETSLHRAYFRPSYETIPFSEDGAFAQALMRERGENLRRTPLLETTYAAAPRWDGLSLPSPVRADPAPGDTAAPITFEQDNDGHITVRLASPGSGLFVLNEQYHPGWKVSRNGTPQPVLRVNTIAQGVLIPGAGSFQLDFQFRGTLSRDLLVSLAGLVAALLGLLALSARPNAGSPVRFRHHL
jgi:hypothetical protein